MSTISTEKLQVLGPRHHVFLIHQPHRCRSFNEDSGHLRSVTQAWPVTRACPCLGLLISHHPTWLIIGDGLLLWIPEFPWNQPSEKGSFTSVSMVWRFDYDFVLTSLLDHEPGIVLKCLSKHFEIHTSWLVLDNLSAESVLAGYHPFPLARWGWIDKWRRHARKHKEHDKCKSSVTHIHTGATGAYRIVSACK